MLRVTHCTQTRMTDGSNVPFSVSLSGTKTKSLGNKSNEQHTVNTQAHSHGPRSAIRSTSLFRILEPCVSGTHASLTHQPLDALQNKGLLTVLSVALPCSE